ncbi:hypothetical protein MMC16_001497 [Acarospora aff. strigata]|nr:hypothetical protein [Acarospora aff. strigata]
MSTKANMANPTNQIPIDELYADEEDSASGTDSQRGRTLASTITQYRYENGRRYHAYREGHYWAPNDEKQNDQQSIAHHLFLLTYNDRLFLAPIEAPKRVLDVGTGTGIWAQDFADQFSDATVIGTDLSPIQPNFAPPNLRFEIDDCCSKWTYNANSFDFIHVRCMYGSVADWPAFYQECFEHLAPGGYIEQAETSVILKSDDGSIAPGDLWDQCAKLAVESSERFGQPLQVVDKMAKWITEAGFEEVTEKRYNWPVGPWSSDPKLKEIGKWNQYHWEVGIEGWSMALLTRVMGVSSQRIRLLGTT